MNVLYFQVPGTWTSKVPKLNAQYPRIECVGSRFLDILGVQVNDKLWQDRLSQPVWRDLGHSFHPSQGTALAWKANPSCRGYILQDTHSSVKCCVLAVRRRRWWSGLAAVVVGVGGGGGGGGTAVVLRVVLVVLLLLLLVAV